MADRDSDESLPDLVASSSSEYDSMDEQQKENKEKKVCLLFCIVVSPANERFSWLAPPPSTG